MVGSPIHDQSKPGNCWLGRKLSRKRRNRERSRLVVYGSVEAAIGTESVHKFVSLMSVTGSRGHTRNHCLPFFFLLLVFFSFWGFERTIREHRQAGGKGTWPNNTVGRVRILIRKRPSAVREGSTGVSQSIKTKKKLFKGQVT